MELHEVKHNKQFINDWNFIDLDNNRLYYLPTPDNNGFHFYGLSWSGNYSGKPMWGESTTVEIAISGWAAFDGVRHLYFGDEQTDNVGYFNYPDLQEWLDLLRALSELQNKYCRDYGGRNDED